MENNKNKYTTNNIALASALIAKDIKLDSYFNENKIIYFTFKNTEGACDTYEYLWFTDDLNVKAFSYFQALKQLKNIVYKDLNNA